MSPGRRACIGAALAEHPHSEIVEIFPFASCIQWNVCELRKCLVFGAVCFAQIGELQAVDAIGV